MLSMTKGAFASVRTQGGQGVRPLLTGSDIPLVLAAIEPLESIYRSVNTYSNFAEPAIEGSPEGQTHAQLGERAAHSGRNLPGRARGMEEPRRGSHQRRGATTDTG
jgi:Bacterial archaeo-eukaryotic release factor family 11